MRPRTKGPEAPGQGHSETGNTGNALTGFEHAVGVVQMGRAELQRQCLNPSHGTMCRADPGLLFDSASRAGLRAAAMLGMS